jgi:hypothetical protein
MWYLACTLSSSCALLLAVAVSILVCHVGVNLVGYHMHCKAPSNSICMCHHC